MHRTTSDLRGNVRHVMSSAVVVGVIAGVSHER
jgi:hypothetical protein